MSLAFMYSCKPVWAPRASTTEARCCKCEVVKPLDAFNRRTKSPNGRQAYCRQCDRG